MVAAALGVAYMVIADDEEVRPGGRSATPGRSAPSAPSPTSAGPEFFSADSPDLTALPDACTSVAPGTVRRLAPGAEMSRPETTQGIGGHRKSLYYRLFDGETLAIGKAQVTVRVRNVIIEVGYSGTDNLPEKWYEDSNETGLPKAAATQGALQVMREIIPRVVNQA